MAELSPGRPIPGVNRAPRTHSVDEVMVRLTLLPHHQFIRATRTGKAVTERMANNPRDGKKNLSMVCQNNRQVKNGELGLRRVLIFIPLCAGSL